MHAIVDTASLVALAAHNPHHHNLKIVDAVVLYAKPLI